VWKEPFRALIDDYNSRVNQIQPVEVNCPERHCGLRHDNNGSSKLSKLSYSPIQYSVARVESQSMVLRIADQILNFLSSRKSSIQGSGHVVVMSSKMLGENVTVVIIFVQVIVARVNRRMRQEPRPTTAGQSKHETWI
jgi:hypothetical protein